MVLVGGAIVPKEEQSQDGFVKVSIGGAIVVGVHGPAETPEAHYALY